MSKKRPYWYPTLCDAEYFARLRRDYPEDAHFSDEGLLQHYNDGNKYQILWDHIGDAYDDYELLSDAFLYLVEKLKATKELIQEFSDLVDCISDKLNDGYRERLRESIEDYEKLYPEKDWGKD
jgi:hypothetical protein